jgi:hypothetical protein
MKKIILAATMLFAVTITQAQKNFYQAIEGNGETAIYEGFAGVSPSDKSNGTYSFVRTAPAVKLSLKKLPTGQPVGFVAEPVSKDYGGFSESEISDYGRVDSYPNVMSIKHTYTDDGYMMIDDLLFVINDIPDNDAPRMEDVTKIYVMVKDRAEASKTEETGKKKKKNKIGGLLNKVKAKLGSTARTPAYKYISTLNIDKIFNDYVAAMKTKQASSLTTKDRADIAKIKYTREAGDEEIRMYNDSIKATPEYKRMLENRRRAESASLQNDVTLYNNTGRTIFVGTAGSRNRGTEISAGGTVKWSCDRDAYLQIITISGGSNAYSSTSTLVYSKNSGCGSKVTVN